MENPGQQLSADQPSEQSPQQPVVPPSTSPSFFHKSKLPLFILIAFVFLVLISGGGYLLNISNLKNQNSNPQLKSQNLTPTQTAIISPTPPQFSSKPENLKAIKADIKFAYFYNPRDGKNLILKQVDFKTNTSKDITLPYLSNYSRDESKIGRYIFSPSDKFILKITQKKLEIAELPNLNFKTIHTVKSITDPKWQNSGQNFDFAHIDDAMWDNEGKLYFVIGVGLDGIGAPPGGAYTDLYVANEDGSNPRLVNDHTKEDQNYGFMKHFAYIDTAKKEIYFSGDSHGGHLATMLVIDATNGILKQSLKDIYTDIVNPIFNDDFSKAYYENDFKEEGGYLPVKIYEYDMITKVKKLIYITPDVDAKRSPYIYNDSGPLIFNKNKLYFQVNDSKGTHFYVMDLKDGGQPKLIFDDGSCDRRGVSENGEYLLLVCRDMKTKTIEYQFYEIPTGKRSVFYKEGYNANDMDIYSIQPAGFR